MEQNFDICVIGGGIQGAGIAQAAALSGLSVALLEKSDWGAGTSSKSSKLIHGGLRYLQSFEFGLVRESLRERRTLLNIASDIVKPNWFYLPVYNNNQHKPWQLSIGLTLYRILAGRKNLAGFKRLPRSEWNQLKGLNTANLKTVFAYQDAQTDDQMLTRRVALSAQEHGATLLCPAMVISAEKTYKGYSISLNLNGERKTIYCRYLVNAAGPWINPVAKTITPTPPMVDVDLVEGTHVEFSQQLSDQCFYLEAQQDHRAIFVMPYKGGTLLGTTEKVFAGNPDHVNPGAEEIEYLLEVIRYHFPHFNHKPVRAWAGLRVLPSGEKNPFSRSREVQYAESENYLAVYGGKLTGYRATAEIAIKKIIKSMGLEKRRKIQDTSKVNI
jgi:glycerol-3-phosphate dehydrogenase